MPTKFSGGLADNAPIEPALYGLLSPAAYIVNETDEHFENGFDYDTLLCGANVHLNSICSGITSVSAINSSGGALYRKYYPFGVETEFKCSTLGMTPEEVEDVAREYLDVAVQTGLEREFWTGALAKAAEATVAYDEVALGAYPNRYLANNTDTVTLASGTAVKAKYAVALLEQALGTDTIGPRGTIHVPSLVGSVLNLKDETDPLTGEKYKVTSRGNYVVIGSGYTGSGPTGAAPAAGQAWIYAHGGRPTVHRGRVYVTPDGLRSQAVDISVNTTKYYASQVVGVTWPTCTKYAALVDLTLDYS